MTWFLRAAGRRDEIVELHKVGDVFAGAGPAELQCIAALEAMVRAVKPIVAVDAGAVSELARANGTDLYAQR